MKDSSEKIVSPDEFREIVKAASTTSEIHAALPPAGKMGRLSTDDKDSYSLTLAKWSRAFDLRLLRRTLAFHSGYGFWESLIANPYLEPRYIDWILARYANKGTDFQVINKIICIAARRGALDLHDTTIAALYRSHGSALARESTQAVMDVIQEGSWAGDQNGHVQELYLDSYARSDDPFPDWVGEAIVEHPYTSPEAFVEAYNFWPTPGLALVAARQSTRAGAPYCTHAESRRILRDTMQSSDLNDEFRVIAMALTLNPDPADIEVAVDTLLTRYPPKRIVQHEEMTDETLALLAPQHRLLFLQDEDAEVRMRTLMALRADGPERQERERQDPRDAVRSVRR